MQKYNLLILGGSGYIGSAITKNLLKKNFSITNIDNHIYDNDFAIKNFINFSNYYHIKDCISSKIINKDFLNKFDFVLILSGLVGDPITKKHSSLSIFYNENYIIKFIQECSKSNIKKIIFTSTCSNYGYVKNNIIADENFPLNPLSIYSKSKIKIENYLIKNVKKHNFQTTILRFATAFGISPRMRFDLTISHFTKDAYLNKFLKIFDGNTWRPYCHVNDFADLIELVLISNKDYKIEIFNSGGSKNNYTKNQIAEHLLNKIHDLKIYHIEGDPDPRDYRVNFDKVNDFFNFDPKFDLNYGIDELLFMLRKENYKFKQSNKNYFGNYDLNKYIKAVNK